MMNHAPDSSDKIALQALLKIRSRLGIIVNPLVQAEASVMQSQLPSDTPSSSTLGEVSTTDFSHLVTRTTLVNHFPPVQLVRRDEVEAALNSKPQRGRKRENLSDMERLELTRTRNREHARATSLSI